MNSAGIEKKQVVNRLIVPVGIVLAVVLFTSLAYEVSWKYGDSQFLYSLFPLVAVLMFISIFFPSFFIYPYTYFKGARPWERIIASFIPLGVWMGKEILRIGSVFSLGESLYFGLNPIFIMLILFTFLQMGLCDPICRWRHKKRSPEKMKIFSRFTVILLFGSLLALFLDLAFALKIGFFYFEQYKNLFTY